MKPAKQDALTSYVVSEFRPTTPALRAHWFNVLTTRDKAEAERMCATLTKGRIETFPVKGQTK